MEELAKFTIGDKAVVGFVSQAGTVGGQLVVLSKSMNKFIFFVVVTIKHYLRWNVDDALLASWVEDLVGVGLILPSLRTVLLSLAPHPVVER